MVLPLAAGLTASWKQAASSLRGSSPPRSGPTAAADDAGNTWLFGGYAEPEGRPRAVVNDLLLYVDGSWTQVMEPDEVVKKSWLPRSNRPGPRLASASVILDGEMLVFGGWDPQEAGTGGIILDDVWSLNLARRTWKPCAPMPRGPTSRHVAVNVGGLVVVHTFRCSDSVLVWDQETRTLREQPTSGVAPSSRGLHAAAAADEHTLVAFGGAAKDGNMVNDAFALDTRSWEWTPLAMERDAPSPSPRAGSCAAPLPGGGGIVVCCGAESGESGLVPRGDAWALEVDSSGKRGCWTLLLDDDAPDAPGPRNAATLTPLGGSELLLHGGWRPFVSTYEDSHVLRIVP